MPNPKFHIGIKNNVSAAADDSVLDLYFLDIIQNPEYFDWNTMQIEEGSMVSDVISQVQYYKPSRIMCHIDSMGGDLDIAVSLYNFLKSYQAKVECKIIGFCASAATILACAASKGKRTMAKNGWFITHQGTMWDVSGQVKDLKNAAEVLDKRNKQMAQILADCNTMGHTSEEILALWDNGDCWMTGEEAEAYGFIDACYNTETALVTARVEEASRMFKNAPKNLIAAEVVETEEKEEQENSIINFLKSEYMKFSDKVTAFLTGKKITAKVSNDNTIDVTATIEPLFVELSAQMQTEVTAEVDRVKTEITASMEEKYGKTITDLSTENTNLKKQVDQLTEDVTAMAGSESRPGAKTTQPANGKRERPTLAGAGA